MPVAAAVHNQDLSYEEVIQLNQELAESWQELIVEVADEKRYGFTCTVTASESATEGAKDLADRERMRRASILQQTNATYNAIKWRLERAAEAAGREADGYKDWIVLTRSGPVVRVFRRLEGDGQRVQMPKAFADAVKNVQARHGRTKREPREVIRDRDAEPRGGQRAAAKG
jgi:hypothetical protein